MLTLLEHIESMLKLVMIFGQSK